jgi:hypothetical protein
MKLSTAFLCCEESCETVHNDPRRCPACGSEAQPFPLARALGDRTRGEAPLPLWLLRWPEEQIREALR